MNNAQLQKNFAALPLLAYIDNRDGRVPGAPSLFAIERGASTYYEININRSASELNAALNVSHAQAEAMFIGLMFGWDVEGAHPDMHNQNLSTEIVDKTVNKEGDQGG